jgi:hypothetical protein
LTKHIILFLAANPLGTDRLALDEEARAIQLELERSGCRERFELVTRWAARPLDLLRELRKLKPTVVHFSGHGGRGAGIAPSSAPGRRRDLTGEPAAIGGGGQPDASPGLYFQGAGDRSQLVSTAALEQTFGAAGASVKLVVLNACYSESQADALVAHVGCVVGIGGAIRDDSARSFATGFYGALGERESVAAAFRQGSAAIRLDGLPDAEQPRLKCRDGVDAERLVLAADGGGGPGGTWARRLQRALRYSLVTLAIAALLGGFAVWRSRRTVLDEVTVAGVVVDASGRPVDGASVIVEGRDFLGESSGDGAFRGRITRVTPGEILTVAITKPGFRRSVHTVTVRDRALNMFRITLEQ